MSADDCILHTVVAAEIADVAETGGNAHAHQERMQDSSRTPLHVQLSQPLLHLHRHAQARRCIFSDAFGFRVAEKDQDGVTDKFVDGSTMPQGDRRHLAEIFVEKGRDFLWLQAFCDGGEVLNIGEKDTKLLPLRMNRGIGLPTKDAPVNLRREIM